MRTTGKLRMAVGSTSMLLLMGGAAFLGLIGLSTFSGSGQSNLQDGVVEMAELGICMEAELFEWVAAAPDPACEGCPKRIPGEQCTRISCDPCCYRCSGEPVPRCY